MAASPSASLNEAKYLLSHVDAPSHGHLIRTAKAASSTIRMPHRTPTEAEAWEAFEAEYKLPEKSSSPVKRQIETVKYGLDVTTFAVDHFVSRIKQDADFNFNSGRLDRATDDRMTSIANRLHVQLDMDVWRSKPYIGVKVVVPVGN